MSQDHTYNGHPNYETWAWQLWMDNEEPTYLWARELARETFADAEGDGLFTKAERAQLTLADLLKDEAEYGIPDDAITGPYADILGAGMAEIDWYHIAGNLLEDVSEDVTT